MLNEVQTAMIILGGKKLVEDRLHIKDGEEIVFCVVDESGESITLEEIAERLYNSKELMVAHSYPNGTPTKYYIITMNETIVPRVKLRLLKR